MTLPRAHILLLNIGCTGRHVILLLSDVTKTSVLFKMADVNAGYLKVKLDLLNRWHPKYARKRIQNAFMESMRKYVPLVTVWHLSAEHPDAKQ